jgi:MerR family copper efflux transcriptional regulator
VKVEAMNIGRAADASGVSAKMIRYYEKIGLIQPADRTDSNYRSFSARDVNDLQFIKRARSLGFSVDEITRLLALWRDLTRPSHEVKAIAQGYVVDLQARISEMLTIAEALGALAERCEGDDRPEYPTLPDLAGAQSRSSARAQKSR